MDRLDSTKGPSNIEAEQQLLGAILVDNSAFDKVSDIITPGSFYEPVHRTIFELAADRINTGVLVSPITLKSAMENDEGLAQLGGPKYLARLAGASMSSFAVRDYAQMVSELKAKRDLLDHMADATASIHDGREPAAGISAKLETKAGTIAGATSTKPLIRSHLNTIIGAVSEINEAYMGETPSGLSTGIRQLDDVLGGGFRKGQFIVLAGRPAMGKTSVAQNLAFNAAKAGTAAFFGSLEMLGEELGKRFLSKGLAEKGISIPYSRMIRGQVTGDEMREIVHEAKAQEALPIDVAEREVREISRLRSAVKRSHQKWADTSTPLGLVVIDYLQLIQAMQATRAYDRVSMASDACKSLAMELEVPVIALSQLSRGVEMRDPPIPNLSDLRESGKVEEDADAVLLCFRSAYYLEKDLKVARSKGDHEREIELQTDLAAAKHDLDIIIDKQRSGPTCTVPAFLDPALCHMFADRSQQAGELI